MKCENWSCWKDCIELCLKVVFVAVFTWGVCNAVCCIKSCKTSCNKAQTSCCSSKTIDVKQCGTNCAKPCCKK